MEIWFIYAVISGVLAGLNSFMGKVFASKNLGSLASTGYSLLASSAFAFLFSIFSGEKLNGFLLLCLLSLGNGIFYMISLATRTKALKNIDSTIYFPIYKVVSGVMISVVGILIFKDTLSIGESFGIAFGLLVPILLINKKENLLQINLKYGIILALVGAITSTIAITFGKVLIENNLSASMYVGISYFIGGVLALAFSKEKYKNIFSVSENKIKRYSLINGFFIGISTYFFAKAMIGNLAIVYTINSFSILIPIILSILFYREKLDFRKAFVIIMSIISILLFKLF